MLYIKLMKMLYFTEKEVWLCYGYSITCDEIFSMPHGPVLSHTYNMITNGSNDSVCNDWISGEDDYCAALNPKVLLQTIMKINLIFLAKQKFCW